MHRRILVSAAAFLLAACSSSYHPEYHPVSVNNVSQQLSYPVTVHNGGAPQERSPVYVVPGPPMGAIPTPAPPPQPPADFFRPE